MIINNNEQSQEFNQKCVKEIIDTIEYALKGCCSLVGFISVNVKTCDLRIHTEVANEVVRYFKEKGFNCRENSDNIILEDFDERHKKYLRDCCSDEKIKEEAIRLKNDLFVYLKQYFRPNGHCYTIGSVECDGCNCTWGLGRGNTYRIGYAKGYSAYIARERLYYSRYDKEKKSWHMLEYVEKLETELKKLIESETDLRITFSHLIVGDSTEMRVLVGD